MKKLIQLFSILIVVAGFSIISANAQATAERYEAKIPFNFSVDGKSYQAGNYVLRISRTPSSDVLYVEDSKNQKLQSLFVVRRGDVAKNSSQLTFVRNDSEWVLAKILTTEKGFTVTRAKNKSYTAKNNESAGSATETTTVDLK